MAAVLSMLDNLTYMVCIALVCLYLKYVVRVPVYFVPTSSREHPKLALDLLGDPQNELERVIPVPDVCDIVVQYNAKFAGKLVDQFKWHHPAVTTVLPLDDTRLAVASRDNTVRIWDLIRQLCICTIQQDAVHRLAVAGEGLLVCMGYDDLVVYNSTDGSRHATIPIKYPLTMASTVKGLAVVGGSDRQLELWTVSRKPTSLRNFGRRAYSLCAVSDGRQIAACFRDRTVRVFDVQTGLCMSKMFEAGPCFDVKGLSGGRVLITAESNMCVWDPTSRSPSTFIDIPNGQWGFFEFVGETDCGTLVCVTKTFASFGCAVEKICVDTCDLEPIHLGVHPMEILPMRAAVMGSMLVLYSDMVVALYR
jgi:WD40 repeat protein